MAQIIKYNSISQEQILANIQSFVQTLPNYNEIKDQLNSSTLMVIYQILAGVSTFNLYNYNKMRQETYLSTATMPSSIQHIAKQFGYNISRAGAPRVEMIYQGIPTIVLKSGDIVGTFKGYNLTYFGVTRFIEKGDKITAYLGDYQTKTGSVVGANPEVIIDVAPVSKKSVDRDMITFSAKGVNYTVQKDIEKFIIYGMIADFSTDNHSTKLYVADSEFNYGVQDLVDGDNYEVAWIETDGYNPNISISSINGTDNLWLPNRVLSYGSDAESDEKIKKLTPFYYSTMRRAVTEQDYTYLTKNHSLIKDCYAQTESGTKGKWQIIVKQNAAVREGESYQIQLNAESIYKYQAQKGDSLDYVVKMVVRRMQEGGWVVAELVNNGGTNVINIEAISTKEDFYPVGSSTIFNTTTEITKHIIAPCCTIDIFYIHANQTKEGEVLSLTEDEQLTLAKQIETFKMAGKTIVLAPATKVNKQIALKVKVKDRTLIDENGTGVAEYILQKAKEILARDYEFQLNVGFSYAEFIASVTKITMAKDFNEYQPIISCVAGQDIFNLDAKADTYYVFDNVIISFEDSE